MMLWPKGSRSTKLLSQNKSLCYLLLGCIFCLLISFSALWLANHDNQQQQQQLIKYHGLIVNQLTVNQLAITMANKDLIGMQSLLQRLSQQKSIVNAVIYDVDNSVIVQSGVISGQLSASQQTFTTPIVLESTLLGSLTTTADIEFKPKGWLLFFIIIGSVLPFILLSRYILKIELTPTNYAAISIDNKQQNTQILTEKKYAYGLLLIKIHDLDKMSKQLNAQARNSEFATLDKLLSNILTLYSGEKIALNQGCIALKFNDEDKDKYLFNAICSAYLLLESAKKRRLFIKLSATLYSPSNKIHLQQEIPQLINLSQADNILINNQDLDCHLLQERLIFEDIENSHFKKVIGFSPSCQKLLGNQLTHLLSVN